MQKNKATQKQGNQMANSRDLMPQARKWRPKFLFESKLLHLLVNALRGGAAGKFSHQFSTLCILCASLVQLLAVVSPLALTSCGYHLGEIRPTPMRSVRRLAVSTFKNRTLEPRVEVLLADSLIHQLQLDGTYQIVGSDVADAILTCTLDKAQRRSIRSVVSNVLATSEFELTLEVTYRVQDRVTGATLMDGKITGSTVFFPTGDLQTDEIQAISVASQRLAVELAGRLTEGW